MKLIQSEREIDCIYLHCTATEPGRAVLVEKIRRYHIDVRHFRDIGYHYVVQPSGSIGDGRDIHDGGAHVKGDNKTTIGVSMVGEWNSVMPQRDDIQLINTGKLLASLCFIYGIKPDTYGLLLHREAHEHRPFVPNPRKSCPGMNIKGTEMRLFVKHFYDQNEMSWINQTKDPFDLKGVI